MSYFKNLTFLKVMTTVAWADGEMTHSELNLLKSFIRKFDLDKKDVEALRPYLDAPVSKKRREELFRQLIAELSSLEEKQEIIEAMETMAGTKKKKSEDELALVAQFNAWLKKSSVTTRSLGRIRNLFQRTIFSHTRQNDPELEKYFKRKVFKKIELRSAKSGCTINLSDDEIYHICLLGTLLSSVAQVDDIFEDVEKVALAKVLKSTFSFPKQESEILLAVIEEQARHGFDFHEVVTETNQIIPYKERVQLIDCFFAIAAADGRISHEESEQIRKITKAMHIPHQSFKESKVRALEALK
ncbi:MAG: TerB family tellurite resistance protein [Nitrospinae bacterium]|jgi:uncharacterized tellurite resistance protein B-like protein|nr:TerB family tellurite resistance protein [Nitrospinota bacterium]MDA1108974.1 TerB family tellurite resistance protein [Nitrospinota bacterium]